LTQAFQLRLAKSAIVSIQNPVHLGAWSAPQPDLCVLRPRPDFYTRSHPTPEDIFLIIEVSHTTIRYDAEVKAGLYAEAGIAEYWQIDIPSRKVIVRTGPARGAYRQQAEYGPDPIVVPGAFPEIHFPVAELLG
jgi:Uma2 family endonuclease